MFIKLAVKTRSLSLPANCVSIGRLQNFSGYTAFGNPCYRSTDELGCQNR
jgi:hypothetical protein